MRYAALIMVLSLAQAHAEQRPAQASPDTGTYMIINRDGPSPTLMIVSDVNGQTVVTINFKSHAITYGPHYTPDAAADEFWEAVGAASRCHPSQRDTPK
jgi:hypothetical protein